MALRQDISELEKSISHTFQRRELIYEALTHRSYYYENIDKSFPHNERLEFLGDSVLALVIVEHLFHSKANYTEASMSKIKSYIVKESVLSEAAEDILLGKYILLGKGENETGGRTKQSILSDALEAVFGAIYIDAGYADAQKTILSLLRKRLDEAVSSEQFFDYKTELQEKTQVKFNALPHYKLIEQEGKEHLKTFTVDVSIKGQSLGQGKGRSKKEAETMAAKAALAQIKII